MLHVGKGDYTLYTNPKTGKVYRKIDKVSDKTYLINTRNHDDYEFDDLSKKIRSIQYWLLLLTEERLTLKAAKLMRRLSICFGSFSSEVFRRIVVKQTTLLIGTLKLEERLDTLPPHRHYAEADLPHGPFNRPGGVVSHQRYGDIPLFFAERRARGAARRND